MLGDVEGRAEGFERGGHGGDGVLVLLQVLARPGERVGAGEVGAAVAGALDGAGEHPGGRQARLEADEHLRRRADEAVDEVGPAPRVGLAQPGDQPARVEVRVRDGDQVAGQHDLVEQAAADVADRPRDRGPPLLGASANRPRSARPTGGSGAAPATGRDGPRPSSIPIWVSQARPARRPSTVRGTTMPEDDGGVVGVEDEAAEGHEPAARHRDVQVGLDVALRDQARSTTPRRPADRPPCAGPPRPRPPSRRRRATRPRRRSRAASRRADPDRARRRSAPAAAGGPGSPHPSRAAHTSNVIGS